MLYEKDFNINKTNRKNTPSLHAESLLAYSTLGKRLEYLRTINNMTQDDVAPLIGKTQPTLLSYEKDRAKKVPAAVLERLAQIYDVTVHELTRDLDNPPLHFLPDEIRQFLFNSNNRDEIIKMYKEAQLKKLEGLE